MDKSKSTAKNIINIKIIESNISDAYDYAETLVNKSHKEITIDDIKKIHWHIYKGTNQPIAGKFRFINYSSNSSTAEAKILPFIDYKDIPQLMDEFIKWLHHAEGDGLKIAADAHIKLVNIHPFFDGNGRTARLLMNLILVQNGYPAAIIDSTHDKAARDEYLNSVAEFNNNRPENYYAYVSKCIKKGSLLATEDPKIYNITDQSIINSNMMNCILMPR
jgi:Fic family protein